MRKNVDFRLRDRSALKSLHAGLEATTQECLQGSDSLSSRTFSGKTSSSETSYYCEGKRMIGFRRNFWTGDNKNQRIPKVASTGACGMCSFTMADLPSQQYSPDESTIDSSSIVPLPLFWAVSH